MTYFEGQSQLGEASRKAIDRAAHDIRVISSEIFENPEEPLGETRAARLLTDFLASSGYEVESEIADMPTAFQATARNFDAEAMRKGLRHGHIAILAEYDADQEGHLSGRHLVAGGAVAAAVGLAEALKGVHGQVTIIGCPAATTLEGKRRLAAADVFEPADVAMGSGPASTGKGFQPTIASSGRTVALTRFVARFTSPADEINARQRVATLAETLLDGLEEQEAISMSLTESGVEFEIRTITNPRADEIVDRLRDMANDAASGTASSLEVDVTTDAPAFNVNRILARRLKTHADSIPVEKDPIIKTPYSGPSDWGYVSLITSTVQAAYPISTSRVETGTREFAEASTSEFAYGQMIACAKAVALTGLDLLGDMELRGFAEGEFIRSTREQGIQRTPRRWLGVHPIKSRETSSGHSHANGSALTRSGKRS